MDFATFYVGAGLHPYLRMCLASWADYGHHLDVYTYDPNVVLPPGVTRRDAEEILPSASIFTYRIGAGSGSVAAFSNAFRIRLMRDRDVVWVDTDVLCLSSNWPDRRYNFGWNSPKNDVVNNAVFGAPPDSELLAQLDDYVSAADLDQEGYGHTGPLALTKFVRELDLTGDAAPWQEFYPVHFHECRMLFDPTMRRELEDRLHGALALHLWDERWSRARVPTFMRPLEGSYLDDALARHHIAMHVDGRWSDLAVLDPVASEPSVPKSQYLELEKWAHDLERQLTERTSAKGRSWRRPASPAN